MSNSNFKLNLSEEEREIWLEIMHNSDGYKVVFKVLDQLTASKEQAMLSRHIDASDKSKNELVCDMIEVQGAKKIIQAFKALRAPSKKQ